MGSGHDSTAPLSMSPNLAGTPDMRNARVAASTLISDTSREYFTKARIFKEAPLYGLFCARGSQSGGRAHGLEPPFAGRHFSVTDRRNRGNSTNASAPGDSRPARLHTTNPSPSSEKTDVHRSQRLSGARGYGRLHTPSRAD